MTQLQAVRGHRPCDWGTGVSVLEVGVLLSSSASSRASSWKLAVIRATEPGGSTAAAPALEWGYGSSTMRTLREQVVRLLTH